MFRIFAKETINLQPHQTILRMNFNQLCIARNSVREYKPTPVPSPIIHQILEAGRMAPSACNKQPWLYIVISDAQLLCKIKETYPRQWFNTAPQVIIVCGDHSASWKRPEDGKDHCDIDVAIAVDHITLQAADLGLGTCWICNFDAKRVTQILDLPPHLEPIAMIPIGYANNSSAVEKIRKPHHDTCFENGWKKPL